MSNFLFFLYNFLIFQTLDIASKPISSLFYTGVIELHVRPDRKSLQQDLSLLKQYIAQNNKDQIPTTSDNQSRETKNGLALYTKTTSDYENLYYVLAEKVLTQSLKGIEGITAFYRGYEAISDTQGRISFPRLENRNEISVLLVSEVSPIILKGQVPDHFIVKQDLPYTFYHYKGEKKEQDEFTTWKIEIKNNENIKGKIPFNTLIILVDPQNAYFETTEKTIQTSNNILLPTLCLVNDKEINNYSNFALNVLRYYKPLNRTIQTTTIVGQTHNNTRLKDYLI